MSMLQTKLSLKFYGESVLRGHAKPVLEVADSEKNILSEMREIMRLSGGVGLAAPQVGVNKQMIVVDIGQGPVSLVNPRIVKKSGSEKLEEGCLSLPGVYVTVRRAKRIQVNALNENNEKIVLDASGLFARVIQHEVDHLRGRLIIDYASVFKKIALRKKLKKTLEVQLA